MKDRPEEVSEDLLGEYDFTSGERGRYAARYAAGTNVVLIEPDLLDVFPDAASVNEALRLLATIARRQQPKRHP